jgi:hypothetical protein
VEAAPELSSAATTKTLILDLRTQLLDALLWQSPKFQFHSPTMSPLAINENGHLKSHFLLDRRSLPCQSTLLLGYFRFSIACLKV